MIRQLLVNSAEHLIVFVLLRVQLVSSLDEGLLLEVDGSCFHLLLDELVLLLLEILLLNLSVAILKACNVRLEAGSSGSIGQK